jgi:hypothetical protein
MYMTIAILFNRFDLQLEHPSPVHGLAWRDQFVIVLKDSVKVNIMADHWT